MPISAEARAAHAEAKAAETRSIALWRELHDLMAAKQGEARTEMPTTRAGMLRLLAESPEVFVCQDRYAFVYSAMKCFNNSVKDEDRIPLTRYRGGKCELPAGLFVLQSPKGLRGKLSQVLPEMTNMLFKCMDRYTEFAPGVVLLEFGRNMWLVNQNGLEAVQKMAHCLRDVR